MSKPDHRHSQNAALLRSVYQELRKIAASTMARLPGGCTLQPTALVHEAWLRLDGGTQHSEWQSRAHFLRANAQTMRRILIDRARHRSAVRHGGGQQRVDIEHLEIPIDTEEDDERLVAVSDAVDKLAVEHPGAAELLELRFFGGLDIPEAAKILGISGTTANRRWKFARTWLYCELHPMGDTPLKPEECESRIPPLLDQR